MRLTPAETCQLWLLFKSSWNIRRFLCSELVSSGTVCFQQSTLFVRSSHASVCYLACTALSIVIRHHQPSGLALSRDGRECSRPTLRDLFPCTYFWCGCYSGAATVAWAVTFWLAWVMQTYHTFHSWVINLPDLKQCSAPLKTQ